jgi:hypothetical protein
MQPSPVFTGDARIADLVRAYLIAEYRWEQDGDWRHLRIGEPAPEVEARYPQARSFGLLSAWDPYSVPRPEAVNRDADESLQQALHASGRIFRPAFSSAANRSWREPSWLVVDMPATEFDALSRRYGQLATLYWAAGESVRMRVDAKRPADAAPMPSIEWLRP